MRKMVFALAAMTVLGASAASAQVDVRVGPGGVAVGTGDRGYDRGYNRGVVVDRRGPGWNRGWRRGGCRMVTVRERRGNTTVVRRFERC